MFLGIKKIEKASRDATAKIASQNHLVKLDSFFQDL
jgi:hypothetical protein